MASGNLAEVHMMVSKYWLPDLFWLVVPHNQSKLGFTAGIRTSGATWLHWFGLPIKTTSQHKPGQKSVGGFSGRDLKKRKPKKKKPNHAICEFISNPTWSVWYRGEVAPSLSQMVPEKVIYLTVKNIVAVMWLLQERVEILLLSVTLWYCYTVRKH